MEEEYDDLLVAWIIVAHGGGGDEYGARHHALLSFFLGPLCHTKGLPHMISPLQGGEGQRISYSH